MAIRDEEHYDAVRNDTDCRVDVTIHTQNVQEHSPVEVEKQGLPITPSSHTNSEMVTPHKRQNYKSPSKQNSSRKKKHNPDQWKRNVHKNARSKGLEYTSTNVKHRNKHERRCLKQGNL